MLIRKEMFTGYLTDMVLLYQFLKRLCPCIPDDELKVPVLRLRDWMEFMLQYNCFHILVGLRNPHQSREEAILQSFWEKFKLENETHPVFLMARQNEIQLSRTVPIILHGDEGRGVKRQPFLVMNFHSALGRGTNPQAREKKKLGLKGSYLQHNINFRGHTYTQRFLYGCLPKQWYANDRDSVFSTLLSSAASEADYMCKTGVTDNKTGLTYYAMLIGISGDWPWLHKSGRFKRSFNNVQKRLNVRNPPKGICHLCRGGQINIPFEQIDSRHPKWLQTLNEESPFEVANPFSVIPHPVGRLAELWKFDLFHTFHIGVGKHFLGSVLALLSELQPAGGIDERFDLLTTEYISYCRTHGINAHIKKISKEAIGWPTTSVFPIGTWHKGDLTTSLMRFVEGRYSNDDFTNNPLLAMAMDAATTINKCMRLLFSSGYFLDGKVAGVVSGLGLRFLRRYNALAQQSLQNSRALFAVMPKEHALHHIFLSMHISAENDVKYIANPLSMSTQCDEDFVGRPSRLSRRTHTGKIQVQRVMQRYLKGAYHQWTKLGYIHRAKRTWMAWVEHFKTNIDWKTIILHIWCCFRIS